MTTLFAREPQLSYPLSVQLCVAVFTFGIMEQALSPMSVSADDWAGVPVVMPIMPPDSRGTNQSAFNNLAWQQFITLNWAADPNYPGRPDTSILPSAFGAPTNQKPVVWESYKESSEVFRPGAEPPTPWKATRELPSGMATLLGDSSLNRTSHLGYKGLFAASKFTDGPNLDLSEFQEAFARGAWLTSQAKTNNYITLFEKRLNEDEFNYINQNQLYDATIQTTFAQMKGINLPDGSTSFASYGTVGAIEIKAAWIQLDDEKLWPLFKTSKAYVTYPKGAGPTTPTLVTVGLVGLHIIRKTPNAQQFIWSTFEHVNNAPSVSDIKNKTLKQWYTYYDAECDSTTDAYHCVQNYQPVPMKDSFSAPVQVVRITPISTSSQNNIVQINASTWATIKAANPTSVFLNYQLVNVLWPNNNTTVGDPGATVPLYHGNPQPPEDQQPVANTLLETYHQNIDCLRCHASAGVASTNPAKKNPPILIRRHTAPANSSTNAAGAQLASDYSFLFSEAQTKPHPPKNR